MSTTSANEDSEGGAEERKKEAELDFPSARLQPGAEAHTVIPFSFPFFSPLV